VPCSFDDGCECVGDIYLEVGVLCLRFLVSITASVKVPVLKVIFVYKITNLTDYRSSWEIN